ncbi:MAG TPA: hypothetical protein VIT38_02195 [Allosphingosinicella sp.]
MRRRVAATLMPIALLLAAAGPGTPDLGTPAARDAYRSQGIGACRRELATPTMSAGDMASFCGCIFDTYMQNVSLDVLPALGSPAFQSSIQPATNYCALRLPAVQAAEMQRRLYDATPAAAGQSRPAPAATSDAALAELRGPGLLDRIRTFGESTPLWAWAAIGLLVLALLLRGLFRRESRSDLIGPPPGMRQSGPVRPRDTDRP